MSAHVLVLEDDADLRDTLADILDVAVGARCTKIASYEELLATPAALESELAILDLNLGPEQPTGVDACRWLRENGYEGKIVFLTGHPSEHPLVEKASRHEGSTVLAKPVPLSDLLALLDET